MLYHNTHRMSSPESVAKTASLLDFQAYGQGNPPLVILHGLMGSRGNWQRIATALAADMAVIVPDLRNHGRSFHAAPHSPVSMAEDVLRLMDALQVDRFSLMGHSMGGKVALQLLSLAPARLKRVAVIDIAARSYDPQPNQTLLSALLNTNILGLETRKELDKAFVPVVQDASLRAFLLKNIQRKENKTFAWQPNVELLARTPENYMCAIALPTSSDVPLLLLKGSASPYVKATDIEALQAVFSSMKTIELPTGHWPHSEQPEAFLAAIRAYFATP